MHVCLVTETYPPEVNGVALTVQGLEQGLRRLGHRVSLVRPQPGEPGATQREDERLVPGSSLPRYPGLRFGWPAARSLQGLWQAQRPDAIYVATEGPLGWSALRCARRLGIPAASGFHTRFDQYAGRYGLGALSPLVFAWLRRFHNGANATLVPTRELAGFLRGRGFRHVELLQRAVETRLFDPSRRATELRRGWGLTDESPCLIHVGRIAPEKDLELAIRAYRAIREGQPDARFVLVGDGPARHALQRSNPDLIFAGVQRGEALAAHFASADLFLFPSRSETFGNVTLEAMASGVPTVAFDYGAAREHLRDGEHGAAVALHDERGFVDAALRLAAMPDLRRRMGRAARAAVAGSSPLDVAARFADLLASLHARNAA